MADRHQHKAVVVRPPAELKVRVDEAVAAMDSNINETVTKFFYWLVGETDELPPRPPVRKSRKRSRKG